MHVHVRILIPPINPNRTSGCSWAGCMSDLGVCLARCMFNSPLITVSDETSLLTLCKP